VPIENIVSKPLRISGITLPKGTSTREPEPQKQLTFNTDKYGELVVTGIGSQFNTGDKSSGITIKTNQGDFLFVSDSYINKGYVYDPDIPGKQDEKPIQYYSRAFVGDQRDEIFNSAVGVDLSEIPEKVTGSQGRRVLYGITGGSNDDLSELVSKKGILIPQDVVESTGLRVNSYRFKDDVGGITGIVDASNNPYIDEAFVYAREGTETAPRGNVDIRYIDQNGLPRYTYSWQDSGGWLSEKLGEVVDFADDLIQNPWARLGVSIFYPAVGTVLNAYAKLDSGEELSGGDIAGLVAAGSNLADVTISDAAAKGLEVGAKLADGASIESIVVDEIASGALEDTEIGQSIKKSVQNNEATVRTVVDVSQGKDLSESIVNNFGDTIVDATGAETTNEVAAVKGALDTAVQLDQGADKDEAALAGMSKYIDEGGTVDLNIDTDLTGDLDLVFSGVDIDLPNIDLPDVSVALPSVDLPEVAVDLPEVTLPEVDLPEVAVDLPEVDLPEVDLPDVSVDLPDVSIDLPEVADINLPDIEGPDLPDVEGPDLPEVSTPTLDLMQFAGLLGGLSTGGGTAPVQEEQAGSQYQTQFNFLAGLEPLGMLGAFQKRA
jgi:hypothetical protein